MGEGRGGEEEGEGALLVNQVVGLFHDGGSDLFDLLLFFLIHIYLCFSEAE